MAVPKKRMSKTKTKVRKTLWKKKADKQACKAISKFVKRNGSSKKLITQKNMNSKTFIETKDIELKSDP